MSNKRNGFTLIEVVTGLVLLAVGLLAVVGMQITSVRGNFFSSNVTQASILAQDRLEDLRRLDVTNARLSSGLHDTPPEDGAIPNSIFFREYTVTDGPSTKTISVTVRWNEGTNHSVSFSTIRSVL